MVEGKGRLMVGGREIRESELEPATQLK